MDPRPVAQLKAVVLVGGEGTRMRPLTETTPKPLLPLMDRPSLDHVLDHLARHGVSEAVLSSPYLEDAFDPFIEARGGEPAITWITETEPLGTGGAVINAVAALDTDGPVFALNGDILTDLDLTAMLEFHRERGASVTIALQRVEDARAFGLVQTQQDGRVLEFLEKPEALVPGNINAGTYLLDPQALGAWKPGGNLSIERDVFPAIIASGLPVFGFVRDAYWLDLGTPEKYLQAHFDIFAGRVRGLNYPAPWVAADAQVDTRSHLGNWVAIGPGAVVEDSARIEDSVLHAGSRAARGSAIEGSILGTGSTVGEGASIRACVLGSGATVFEGARLEGVKVGPGAVAG